MTYRQILAWGKQHHYPFLQIGQEANPPTQDVLGHGREHYEALRHEKVRRVLTSLRIERWTARLTRVQVDRAIEAIDEVLSTMTSETQMEERIEV